jgi:hypothetical protein
MNSMNGPASWMADNSAFWNWASMLNPGLMKNGYPGQKLDSPDTDGQTLYRFWSRSCLTPSCFRSRFRLSREKRK